MKKSRYLQQYITIEFKTSVVKIWSARSMNRYSQNFLEDAYYRITTNLQKLSLTGHSKFATRQQEKSLFALKKDQSHVPQLEILHHTFPSFPEAPVYSVQYTCQYEIENWKCSRVETTVMQLEYALWTVCSQKGFEMASEIFLNNCLLSITGNISFHLSLLLTSCSNSVSLLLPIRIWIICPLQYD